MCRPFLLKDGTEFYEIWVVVNHFFASVNELEEFQLQVNVALIAIQTESSPHAVHHAQKDHIIPIDDRIVPRSGQIQPLRPEKLSLLVAVKTFSDHSTPPFVKYVYYLLLNPRVMLRADGSCLSVNIKNVPGSANVHGGFDIFDLPLYHSFHM